MTLSMKTMMMAATCAGTLMGATPAVQAFPAADVSVAAPSPRTTAIETIYYRRYYRPYYRRYAYRGYYRPYYGYYYRPRLFGVF